MICTDIHNNTLVGSVDNIDRTNFWKTTVMNVPNEVLN